MTDLYQCDICNTRTYYEKTRCDICSIAFKKGYDQAVGEYRLMLKSLIETMTRQ